VFSLVIEYRGSITGEHGDGLVRSRYVEQMFGKKVYKIFSQIKSVFDPTSIMNPGKKITDDPTLMTKNLRYGTSYRRRPVKTALNWNITGNRLIQSIIGYSDEFTYEDEVELCHGCGTCRELTPGRMCPVFKAYHGEVDSCRGRLSVLRWLLKTDGLPSEFEVTDEYQEIIYNHCVQCRMCHIECPSNVNVGKLMAEARARYSTKKGVPKGYRYFADIDRYGELGSRLAPLSNHIFENTVFRMLLEWFAGIDRRRGFPSFSRQTFAERFREYKASVEPRSYGKSLVFFYDTYINYNDPDLGISIVKILEKNGYNVLIPLQKSSGLPAILEGSPDMGRKMAEYNVTNLAPYAEKGFPIVTFSPSSGVALKVEYLNVLDTPASRAVADSTFDIHEFLYSLHNKGELVGDFRSVEKDVYVHLHCHDLVQKIEGDITGFLGLLPGLKFSILERGCCGIGGAFGFVKGNYERSMRMGEPLFDAVKSADRPVYSTGESCALQMEAGSGRRVGLTV
ncbi:MAG: FAD-linked oxidase C-terminal domain-containing protein, partial [Nitrososphaerales archaeon]